MKICVHKSGRLHPSTKLLCEEFGISDYYQYQSKGLLGKIPKAGDFFYGKKAAESLSGYDAAFLEGLSCAPLVPHLHRKGLKTIAKGNSHEIFFMDKKPLWRVAFNSLDLDNSLTGMIAVSQMIHLDFRRYFRFPIEVAEGFMYRDYASLKALEQEPGQRNFLFIGKNPYLKGLDIMVEIFLRLKKERAVSRETVFTVVGSESHQWLKDNIPEDILHDNGIHSVPYTDDIDSYLRNSFFMFHLARYEPNAVSVMEGMSSGLIPIISRKTGNKDFVNSIYSGLVADISDKEKLYNHITGILSLDGKRLAELQKEFRSKSERYSKEAGLKRWQTAWKNLLRTEQ